MKSRSLLIFENSIKSEATRQLYNYALKKFVNYYKLKSVESILEVEDKKLQEMLEDYLFFFKSNGKKTATIRSYFAGIELLCVVNDKTGVNFKKIHKMFPANVKKAGKNPYSTSDLQEILKHTKELRTKAIVHILASTGMRVGALPDLKLKHLVEMPNNCMAALVYEDSDEEYWSFLTPEATSQVREYLAKRAKDGERMDPSHPLIRERYGIGIAKPRHISRTNIKSMLHRLLKLSTVNRTKEGNRFDVMEAHGMRKRFNTILKMNKDIAPAVTEKLMGHHINLDGVYFNPSRDELFDEFKKAIPELTIDDAARTQVQLEIANKKKDELEKAHSQLWELKKQDDQRWERVKEFVLKKDRCALD